MGSQPSDWWDEMLRTLEQGVAGPQSAKDSAAWEAFRERLRRLASILVHQFRGDDPEDVEDLVQETLLRLQSVPVLRRIRAARSPEGYLVVLMRNLLIDQTRRARFEARWRAGETTPELAELPALEDLITLRQQLDDLADSEQRLLHMRFWEGLSIGEIAERLGEKYSTISVRLFRLLKRLEAALGP